MYKVARWNIGDDKRQPPRCYQVAAKALVDFLRHSKLRSRLTINEHQHVHRDLSYFHALGDETSRCSFDAPVKMFIAADRWREVAYKHWALDDECFSLLRLDKMLIE